jgi:hypothetical protein
MVYDVRKTIDNLSSAGLVIWGRLLESDAESVTIDADGVHYELLVEHITNREEVANAKSGDAVEVRVSPDAKIVEKRLIEPNLPGIITGGVFGSGFGRQVVSAAACIGVCDQCGGYCTECSYCVCECSICSVCISYCTHASAPMRSLSGRGFRRFVR